MFGDSSLIGMVGLSDLDRAADFSGTTLGIELTDERPFALVAEIGGSMLRITGLGQPVVARYTVLGRRVSDIASASTSSPAGASTSPATTASSRMTTGSGRQSTRQVRL